MKKLIILFTLVHCQTQAQQVDSTQIKIEQIKKALNYMAGNLESAHDEYRAGIICLGIGTVATTGGIIWLSSAKENSRNTPTILTILGGALQLAGSICIIDSHKFIGRAGSWRFSGNKFEVWF